ncbi:MAG: TIR domain-containing protein [Anaerolineae bacterium]|nr:TIR domain-containing protein [Anaerolineae bacterium]
MSKHTPDEPNVFISHATKDDDTVTRLHDELEAATGHALWVDHKDLKPPESNWRAAIQAALKSCRVGLVVLSRNAVKRPEIVAEWTYLLNVNRPLLVARIDDVPLEDIDYRLHIVQWIDLARDWDAGIRALAAAIRGEGLPEDAPVVLVRPITGLIEPRLLRVPITGRDHALRRIKEKLQDGPTMIIAVGGAGKSRLAAELALGMDGVNGAIWHTCSDITRPDDVLAALRTHARLDPTASRDEVFGWLRGHPRLVVLDNAESVPADCRADCAKLANELFSAGAHVLLTSRGAWKGVPGFELVNTHRPRRLPQEPAQQIVLNMAQAWEVPHDLEPYAERIASAARQHPRLIEWAVRKMGSFEPQKVIRELKELKSKSVQAATKEMIGRTLDQMTGEAGPGAAAALRRLAVCRGGFSYHAAGFILGLFDDNAQLDEDTLDEQLEALITWQFVTAEALEGGRTRYAVEPVVLELNAVQPDEDARRPHYDYYEALARQHDKRQDYLGLDVESDNLAAAFEWALDAGDAEAAYWLANACGHFLANRGRFDQRLDWCQRAAAALEDHPDDRLRAAVQVSLGNAYRELPTGDRRANLGRAVAAFEEALRFYTPEAAPLDYAMTQTNLGAAYADLAEIEDRAGNLARAVAAFQEALRFRTPETAPLDYAMTQNNLGTTYADLAAIEDRAGNLKRAVTAFEQALRFRTPEAAPQAYAMTQTNLGAAYRQLSEIEDRAENLKRAVAAYEQALRFRTPEAAPLAYATTQNNLGAAYQQLSEIEDRAENLERAVAAYEQALRFRTPEAAPLYYAGTQNNLGETYRKLSEIEDRAGNLKRAVTAFQEALRYGTPETAPLYYAETQNNLGIAYAHLADIEDRASNLERAVVAYEQALRFRTPEAAPLAYAMTQANLGIAQEELGDLPAAVACWREAERYYRQMGAVQDADKVQQLIDEADAGGA